MHVMNGKPSPKEGRILKRGSARIGTIIAVIILSLFLLRSSLADAAIVQGRSMLPGLRPGDVVLIFKAAYGLRNPFGGYIVLWGRPKNRDIVAAKRPGSNTIVIKRVQSDGGMDSDKEVYLLGDNNYESVDSREFGPVPINNILGRVVRLPRF